MNEDMIQGKWKQLKGQIKKQWGKLTDQDLTVAEGHRDYLAGRIQERYGCTREEAQEQIRQFERVTRDQTETV